jgi:hypothetical protein
MSHSQWHRFYTSKVAARPELLFGLLSDMPNYGRWLPPSGQFASTTDVEPYPVRLGSRYHDGKPAEPGKDWWGSVTGFRPPGSIDFHHTIRVRQLRATVDVHIHYSFEKDGQGTVVSRWLVLDVSMPVALRPLRPLITSRFDEENLRTMAAVKQYAEAHPGEGVPGAPASATLTSSLDGGQIEPPEVGPTARSG